MTFQAHEQSQATADPKELYKFTRGAKCWLYTSADEDTVYQAETYAARTISRSNLERSDEHAASEIEIRLDRALGVVAQFEDGSTPEPVLIQVFRLHRPDAEAIVLFKGRIANASIELEEIVMVANSPLGKDEKRIPRELILRTCPHELYGERCRVIESAFQTATTIAIAGAGGFLNKYQVPGGHGQPSGQWTGGILTKDATGQKGFIQSHPTTNVIWLLRPMPGLAVSDDVTISAGCDRTVETCRDKFDNVPEFGGFPALPERNPFISIPADDILSPSSS